MIEDTITFLLPYLQAVTSHQPCVRLAESSVYWRVHGHCSALCHSKLRESLSRYPFLCIIVLSVSEISKNECNRIFAAPDALTLVTCAKSMLPS